jgi:hypothetical protein
VKKVIEFPLEAGGTIAAEVEDREVRTMRGPSSKEVVEKAHQTFESALDKIKPAAAAIVEKLRDLRDSPDQVAVEFGIVMNAAAGVIVASSGLNAHFKITITWKREPKER